MCVGRVQIVRPSGRRENTPASRWRLTPVARPAEKATRVSLSINMSCAKGFLRPKRPEWRATFLSRSAKRSRPRTRRDPRRAKIGTEVIRAGYQVVPDVLVRYQGRLGLSPTDVCVLLNLGAHWWYPESQPSPRSQTIAHRMNVHVRMVQRSLSSLKAAGFIDLHKEGGRRHYDLKPLVGRRSARREGPLSRVRRVYL